MELACKAAATRSLACRGAAVLGPAARVPLRHCAHDDEPHGHHDRLRLVLQHAARPDRPAVVRPRSLLWSWRVLRRARNERYHPCQAAGSAAGHAACRRRRGARVCRHLRIGLDPARRHGVRDDLPRACRAGGIELADPARLLRRRGGHHHQPHANVSPLRLEFRSADPGLLSNRGLVPHLDDRHLCGHSHAVRSHVQRGARIPSASSSSAAAGPWCVS